MTKNDYFGTTLHPDAALGPGCGRNILGVLRRSLDLGVVPRLRARAVQMRIKLCKGTSLVGIVCSFYLYILRYITRPVLEGYIIPSGRPGHRAGVWAG